MMDDKLRQQFFRIVLDLGLGIQSQIEELLSEEDLTYTQSMLLFRLYREDQIQFKDLAKYQKISKGAVSQLVRTLQEKDLVLKEQSNQDKRDWYVRLTKRGKNILREINEKRANEMQFMYDGIDSQALEFLVQNLKLIKENIDEKFNK
jgi:DNA-binding MarR family transcriptional regulator